VYTMYRTFCVSLVDDVSKYNMNTNYKMFQLLFTILLFESK